MSILEPKDRPFDDVEHVGLAIKHPKTGLHCSFVYRTEGGEVRVLGLAFHHIMEDEEPNKSYRWAQIGLDPDNKEVLALLLSRIKHIDPKIPYGFNSKGIVFSDDGSLLDPPAGRGLTCATFISAALKVYGHDLLDIETWPDEPRDSRQFELIMRWLKSKAGEEHVNAIRLDKGGTAINPDEIVGAGNLAEKYWPVKYETARELADRVLHDLGE